jgi:hypothetical protein
MRDEKLAIVGNLRPAAPVHHQVVQRLAASSRFFFQHGKLGCGDALSVRGFERQASATLFRLSRKHQVAFGVAGQCHAEHPADETTLESIARIGRDECLFVNPAASPAPDIGSLQVLPSERQLLL